jgi:predicted Rossmann fold flavoprotein
MALKKLVVIGGGAAGFFCAVNAARMNPGLSVTIMEKSSKVLSKVKISGGGRCNVTHACFTIPEMIKKYPRGGNFLKKCFYQFFTTDTINWFLERGIILKTEPDGRMFPVSDDSQTIIDCLVKQMNKYGVKLELNREVKEITQEDGRWIVRHGTEMNTTEADYVCIASGGYPKAASFEWLRKLGHSIAEPVPSLFTFNMPSHPITALMGISVELAQVKIMGSKLQETGPLLITHWGMSGPAILRLSAWGAALLATNEYQFNLLVNWIPHSTEPLLRAEMQSNRNEIAAQKMYGRNGFGLPQRLWEFILTESGCKAEWRWADLPSTHLNRLLKNLLSHEFEVKGKTTYKEEFVTAGGVQLNEINPHTMESKIAPNIFFAGEVMNVDGITGGFNFQHAWTSGWIAANAIAGKSSA